MRRCDWLVFNSCDWCVSILAVLVHCCSLGGPLSYSSPVVFSDRVHPCFRNFNSTIPVEIVRVKTYVNCLVDPACVPRRITINKLNLIPNPVQQRLLAVLGVIVVQFPNSKQPVRLVVRGLIAMTTRRRSKISRLFIGLRTGSS